MVGQSVTKSAEVGNRNRWYSSNVVDIEPAAPPRTVRALHNEHIYMSNLLDSVEEQIAQIQAGREADFNLLLDIVDYMKSFPDRFHHPKEDLIYQRMAMRDKASAPAAQKLIEEHRLLEGLIGRLGDSIDDYHTLPTVHKRNRVAELCSEYIDRMREHINEEETVVLPRSMAVLREEDWFLIDQQSTPLQEIPIDDLFVDNYAALRRYLRRSTERLANTVVLVEFLGSHAMLEVIGGIASSASHTRYVYKGAASDGMKAYRRACRSWFPLVVDQAAGEARFQNVSGAGWQAFWRRMAEEGAPRRVELVAPFSRAIKLYTVLIGGRKQAIEAKI